MANNDTEARNARSGSIKSRSKKHSESEDSETVDDFVPSKQFDFRFTEEKLLATKRSKFVQLFILLLLFIYFEIDVTLTLKHSDSI